MMLALGREGIERSATFSTLVDTNGRSNGIVYIEFGYCAFGHPNGCLLPHIAPAHGDRYLRIIVTPDKNRRSHEQLLALAAGDAVLAELFVKLQAPVSPIVHRSQPKGAWMTPPA